MMLKPTRILALENDLNRIWNRMHGIPLPPPDELAELTKEHQAKIAEWRSLLAQHNRTQPPANPITGPL